MLELILEARKTHEDVATFVMTADAPLEWSDALVQAFGSILSRKQGASNSAGWVVVDKKRGESLI